MKKEFILEFYWMMALQILVKLKQMIKGILI